MFDWKELSTIIIFSSTSVQNCVHIAVKTCFKLPELEIVVTQTGAGTGEKTFQIHLKHWRFQMWLLRKTEAVRTRVQIKTNRMLQSDSARENERCEEVPRWFVRGVCLCCALRGGKNPPDLTPCQDALRTLTAVRLMSRHKTSKHRQRRQVLYDGGWSEERERKRVHVRPSNETAPEVKSVVSVSGGLRFWF